VEIVDVDFVFDGLKNQTRPWRRAHKPPRAPTAGHPHRETIVVVIAAVDLAGIRSRCGQFKPSACRSKIRRPRRPTFSSSSPRCLRSFNNAAMAWSDSFASRR